MTLHPEYSVVSGSYKLTNNWSVDLPIELSRRIEDGDLVLWRPGLTFWIAIWGNDSEESQEDRVLEILKMANTARTEQQVERDGTLTRLTYELTETDPEREHSIYGSISGHVLADTEHVQISSYFDTPEARSLGYRVIHSVRHVA